MKNKTVAAWLALCTGPLGIHRFYLFDLGDTIGWALPIPTALGLYGIARIQQYGLDDPWSWVLLPVLGLTIAGCALNAIVYGLKTAEQWNVRFNPAAATDAVPGKTNWLTIGAIVASLLIGTTVLMASIAYGFQHYFEYQIEVARRISQYRS